MDIKSKIKSLLKEADLYRSQGLLSEAKGIYEEALRLIQTRLSPKDAEKISQAITAKITSMEKEIIRVEKKVLSPSMTKESQDLITKMFTPAEGEDRNLAAMEAAKALMKFGQFERAKEELAKLIEIDQFRVDVSKQILNCFFLESKYDEALKQYNHWSSNALFSKQQIDTLGAFIKDAFSSKGIKLKAFEISPEPPRAKVPPESETKMKPSRRPEFEQDNNDFEEFDILASIKKSKKT